MDPLHLNESSFRFVTTSLQFSPGVHIDKEYLALRLGRDRVRHISDARYQVMLASGIPSRPSVLRMHYFKHGNLATWK